MYLHCLCLGRAKLKHSGFFTIHVKAKALTKPKKKESKSIFNGRRPKKWGFSVNISNYRQGVCVCVCDVWFKKLRSKGVLLKLIILTMETSSNRSLRISLLQLLFKFQQNLRMNLHGGMKPGIKFRGDQLNNVRK